MQAIANARAKRADVIEKMTSPNIRNIFFAPNPKNLRKRRNGYLSQYGIDITVIKEKW